MSCLMMPRGHSRGKLNDVFSFKSMMLGLAMSSSLVMGPMATVPALATDTEVAQANVPDSKTAKLSSALEEAKKEIKRLTGVAEFTRVQYSATKNKLQSTVLQLEALAKVRGDGVYEVAKLRANLDVAQGEIERLTTQLTKIEEGGRAEKDAADGLNEVRAQLKARDEELRNVKETAEASATEAKQLRVVLAATGEKAKSLQAKLEVAQALEAGQDKLRSDLLKAKAQISSQTAVAATTRKEFESVQAKVRAAATRSAELEKENKGLTTKLAAAEKARDEGIQSLANIRTAKAEQDKKFVQVSDELTEVSGERGRLQSELDKALAKHAAVIDQLTIAGKERDSIEDQLRLAEQATQEQSAKHQAKLVALRNIAIEQDNAMNKAADDLKTAKAEADVLANQKNVLLTELETVKQGQVEAVQKLGKTETARVEQGEALRETGAALQKSVKEVVALEDKLQALNNKAAKLQTELNASQKVAAKVAGLEANLNSSKSRVAELVKAHEISLSKVEVLGSELQAVEVKMGDLVADKKNILSQVDGLKANLTTAEVAAGQKQAALDELTQTKLSLNNTVKMLSVLQATKSSQDDALKKANVNIQASVAETDQLSASLKTANDKIVLLDAKLKEADAVAADINVMNANLQKAGQRIEDLTAARQASEEQLSKLQTELKASRSKGEAIGKQRRAAEAELTVFKDKLALLNKEVEEQESNTAEVVEARNVERKEAESNIARLEALANSRDAELKKAVLATEQANLQIQRFKDKLADQQKELAETSASAETALAELSSTRVQISERIRKMIAVAVAAPSAEYIELQKKFQALAKENEKLKEELLQKADTAASQ